MTAEPLLQTKLYAPRVTGSWSTGRGWPTGWTLDQRCCSSPLRPASGSRRCSPSAARDAHRPDRPTWPGCPWTPATATRRRTGPTCSRRSGTAVPGVGETAQALLESPGGPPITTVLTIARQRPRRRARTSCSSSTTTTSSRPPTIHEAMGFLVDHLPPPGAPGHRQPGRPAAAARAAARARRAGRGTRRRPAVHRAARPRRTSTGWASSSSAGEVATLEGRTEGWIAALQLAALSLQGRDDVAGFIDGLRRRRPVRRRLPRRGGGAPPARGRPRLPPRTSCWTGSPDRCRRGHRPDRRPRDGSRHSTATTCSWSPLDDHRRWYRYHHLFADMLRARLLDEHPEPGARAAPPRQRVVRAGRRHDGRPSSTRSRPATSDRAAGLVEARHPGPDQAAPRGPAPPLDGGPARRGLRASPPVLANGYVGALMSTGEIRGVEPRLRLAEELGGGGPSRCLRASSRPALLVAPTRPVAAGSPGWVRIHRAGLALMAGDVVRHHRPRPGGAGGARPGRRPGTRCGHRPHGTGLVAPGRPRDRGGGVRRDHPAVRARGATSPTSSAAPSRWPSCS